MESTTVIPCYPQGIGFRIPTRPPPPPIPKSTDGQVPYIKWWNTVSSPYLRLVECAETHGYGGPTACVLLCEFFHWTSCVRDSSVVLLQPQCMHSYCCNERHNVFILPPDDGLFLIWGCYTMSFAEYINIYTDFRLIL